jgi:hypothetical protein
MVLSRVVPEEFPSPERTGARQQINGLLRSSSEQEPNGSRTVPSELSGVHQKGCTRERATVDRHRFQRSNPTASTHGNHRKSTEGSPEFLVQAHNVLCALPNDNNPLASSSVMV